MKKIFHSETARSLDAEASAAWGLPSSALVEAAGRSCARCLVESFPAYFEKSPIDVPHTSGMPYTSRKFRRIVCAAGSGNNAADALVMLRALITEGFACSENCRIVINRLPEAEEDAHPRSLALRVLEKMGVETVRWEGCLKGQGPFDGAEIIIDGIAGTGLNSALRSTAGEMVRAINECGKGEERNGERPLVVSLDVPSGNFDGWDAGMGIIKADICLAVEPLKRCLYKPAARAFAGTIVPVEGIFPPALVKLFEGNDLVEWKTASRLIPPVGAAAHKYERGLVEIHAGSPGSAGAARIAARGAQAAGAGLVRLIVDHALYPLLAADAGGIMVAPKHTDEAPYPRLHPGPGADAEAPDAGAGRFKPDAMLLGPGWGKGPDRLAVLEEALKREERGMPLILDADAVSIARDCVFHGRTILTPHVQEFAVFSGIPREKLLADPFSPLSRTAKERNCVILFKSHVLIIAAGDGRLGILDGMKPVLASGGSGDLLAGFCAALAARLSRSGVVFDGYDCAAAAAALLLETASLDRFSRRFTDPLELADGASEIAGAAWLPAGLA
ncbi:MAG: bifunctional ADP-dependent NAD(P)H-hydrate dehydratase/NAD(P)H-hydrate epimerase [Treponema sp.]|jgi:NAD(P)H-hydrate epimerase|nr:bifunctional ADP-dependent NAD(P)H-hydrate dehydratase/NAD(P)H-hydrate epimerase [Treponema sp.]